MTNPLFAKKPMQMLMEETQESGEHTLRRTLGPIHLTALGIGAIIGAGIFVLSGLGAHYAGPGLMLSFVLSGLGTVFAWNNPSDIFLISAGVGFPLGKKDR